MPHCQKTALPRSAATRGERIRQSTSAFSPYRQDPAPAAPARPHCPARSTWRVRWPRRVSWPWRIGWKRSAAVLGFLIIFVVGRMACSPHRQEAAATVRPSLNHSAGIPLDKYGAVALIPSPNYDVRPVGTTVTAIVLHATATATGQEAVNAFLNPKSKTSSHFIIDRNGAVIEMVPPERRAWHAGVSALDGVTDVNSYSIGIELVDRNNGEPYSDAQYAATAALIRRLRTHYDIPEARIVSHAAVAPGRKSDPLGFDFARLYTALRS